MGRYAQDTGGGDFQQAPEGSHIGRCIRLIDIGTHHGEYQGAPTIRNQVIVQWEIPGETIAIDGEDKPLVVSKFYTNSLSEKANLRKDLETWRARAFSVAELLKFDLMTILGAPAMLSVVHNEKGKAVVQGVMKLPKGVTCPDAFNESDAFWIDEWDQQKFDDMSKGFQRLIMDSDEYKASVNGAPVRSTKASTVDTLDDDIPF